MANPTAGWYKLGDSIYRRIKLYDATFSQSLELDSYYVAGAPFGGALALCRNEEKVQALRTNQSAGSNIEIYSCSGKFIRTLNWDRRLIKGLGWSDDETLMIVSEDGKIRYYDNLQADFSEFSLGSDAAASGVRDCRFYAQGCLVMLNGNQLLSVAYASRLRPKRLATLPDGVVHSWAVIPPTQTSPHSAAAFLAVDKTIFAVDLNEAEDRMLPYGPFKHVVVSPNGAFLALYTAARQILIVTCDFQHKLGEFELQISTIPKDVQWCGNDSVLLAWEDEIQLVGPQSSNVRFFFDNQVFVVPELDGVRLLTKEVCEVIEKVPDATQEIFQIGSTSPSSILLDAARQLDEGSPKAAENIELIRTNLSEAVAICVKAAGQQYDIFWQKLLLKAASFGKSVLDLYSSDDFVEMCHALRIMNSVRQYTIGMPISYPQLKTLSLEKLVERLVSRQSYQMALQIAESSSLPTNRIFLHWASQKIRTSKADEKTLATKVIDKVGSRRGISFEDLAQTAFAEGRIYLATQFLNEESRAGKQVPLLMSMNEPDFALAKAVTSSDPDLVLFVLDHLKKSVTLASFFRTLSKYPLAAALTECAAQVQDETVIKDLYHHDDRRLEAANFFFLKALMQKATQTKIDAIRLSATQISNSAKDPRASQTLKVLSETQSLLRHQAIFDEELSNPPGDKYRGLPLHKTVYCLMLASQDKRAQKLAQEFRLDPAIYEWIRLRALITTRNWFELDKIAQKTKHSAIGWEAYYTEILGAGNPKLAGEMFVPKCTNLDVRERSEMWMKSGMIKNAAEALFKAKDLDGLGRLRGHVGSEGKSEIDSMLAMLKEKDTTK